MSTTIQCDNCPNDTVAIWTMEPINIPKGLGECPYCCLDFADCQETEIPVMCSVCDEDAGVSFCPDDPVHDTDYVCWDCK